MMEEEELVMRRGHSVSRWSPQVRVRRSARRTICCLVGAVVIAVIGACGGDDEPAADEGSGEAIKVMLIAAEDNPVYAYPDFKLIAQAYADELNEQGGIGGRELEIIPCNDFANPNQAQQCARRAVSEEVDALVGGLTLYGQNVWPILEAAKIPWISNIAVTPSDYQSPMSFPVNLTNMAHFAMADLMGSECSKPSMSVLGNQGGETLLEQFLTPAVKMHGKDWHTTVRIPPDTTDFAPIVARLTADGADCFGQVSAQNFTSPTWAAAEQAGTEATPYTGATQIVPATLEEVAPNLADRTRLTSTMPAPTSSVWDTVREMVEKHVADTSEVDLTQTNQLSLWTGYVLFGNVAKAIEGEVTSESLIEELGKDKPISTDGIIPPLNYGKPSGIPGAPRFFNTYVFYLTLQDGEVVADSEEAVDLREPLAEALEEYPLPAP
jgi:ABC-type branched-subunit amino acid transport system substrate-binding protein